MIGVSYNATDITERKLHEQHILQQNESLKSIAYMQSHELRKPVASILGLVNIIQTDGYQATAAEIDMLGQAAEELDRQIRSIVTLSADAS